eukprot:313255-Prymnesium_polylepis.1
MHGRAERSGGDALQRARERGRGAEPQRADRPCRDAVRRPRRERDGARAPARCVACGGSV